MKTAAFTLVCAFLLSACQMAGNKPPNSPTEPSSAPESCLAAATPAEPLPSLEPWSGALPPSIPGAVWVLTPMDDKGQDRVLAMVVPEKGVVLKAISVKAEQYPEAVQLLTAAEIDMPLIMFAVLGGVRPYPQPGPLGVPDLPAILSASLNAANGLVWSARGPQAKLEQPPVTHQ